MNTNKDGTDFLLPEKPSEPLESECCGTGCTPCVFDIYRKQVTKWEKICQEIISGSRALNEEIENDYILTPFEYKQFQVLDILPDATSSSKVIRFSTSPEYCDHTLNFFTSDKKFPVKIGQHILFKSNKDSQVARKYTILRIENEFEISSSCNYFDVLVRLYPDGQMSQFLDKIIKGDNVLIRGPFNNEFKYTPNFHKALIMLAAGTGVAPMYRIIETVLRNEDDETRIRLFFSNKSVGSILCKRELQEWSGYWNFQVEHYITGTDHEISDKVPYGMKVNFQKINLDVIQNNFGSETKQDHLYLICGTKSFEKDMINYLQKLGIDNKCIQVF